LSESTTKWVGERYDRMVEEYATMFSPVIRPFAEGILEFASLGLCGTIADVGCGTGALVDAWHAAAPAATIIGIDASFEMLRRARLQRCGGDAGSIPLGSGAVDAAVCCFVLQHVAQPVKVVREMARIVRPGGVVATVTWGAGYDYAGEAEWNEILDEAGAAEFKPPVASHSLLDEPEKMRAIFSSAGLAVHAAVTKRREQRWKRAHLWETLTGYGKYKDRIATLSEHARAAALAKGRAMVGALPDSAFIWRPEIVYAVAVKR